MCCALISVAYKFKCLPLFAFMHGQMIETNFSQLGQVEQIVPQGLKASEDTTEPPKQVGGLPIVYHIAFGDIRISLHASHFVLC